MPPLYRLLLVASLAVAACSPPSPGTGEAPPNEPPGEEARPTDTRPIAPEAVALTDSAGAIMRRFTFGQADTAEAHRALQYYRQAYRFDTRFVDPLQGAYSAYLRLGEPDSAVAVLELGVDEAPGLGELIGYVRYQQGRRDEAAEWFERARAHTARQFGTGAALVSESIEGEAAAGGYVRQTWLAQGQEAAAALVEGFPPALRSRPQVKFAACVANTASLPDYLSSMGFEAAQNDVRDLMPDSDESATEACTALLFEEP